MADASIGVYLGTFDPITFGHFDVIHRAARIFSKVVVGVCDSRKKEPLFSVSERISLIEGVCSEIANVRIESFEGLAVQFAERHNAGVMIRGLRSEADYLYEMQMATMNKRLYPDGETIFIPTRQDLSHVSSSLVKEVAELGGDIGQLVHPIVADALAGKFGAKSLGGRNG